jgi:hypothetical protein
MAPELRQMLLESNLSANNKSVDAIAIITKNIGVAMRFPFFG